MVSVSLHRLEAVKPPKALEKFKQATRRNGGDNSRFLHVMVAYPERTVFLEHPVKPEGNLGRVGQFVKNVVKNGNIYAVVLKTGRAIADDRNDISQVVLLGGPLNGFRSQRVDVQGIDPSSRADQPRRGDRVTSGAATEIKNRLTR